MNVKGTRESVKILFPGSIAIKLVSLSLTYKRKKRTERNKESLNNDEVGKN